MIGKHHPELPNVPLAIEFAKTDEARKLTRAAVHTFRPTSRPYVLPPETPKERVEMSWETAPAGRTGASIYSA